jgi:hypothetical protein
MKTYTNNLDYQGLVAAYEKAKDIFKAAKTSKKEVKALYKAAKKEGDSHIAHIQFRQAKLNQKIEKLAARIAKLKLKEWLHVFKKAQKKEAVADKKIDGIETAMLKNGAANHKEVLKKSTSKTKSPSEKIKKTVKVLDKITEKAVEKPKPVVVAENVVKKPKLILVTEKVVEKPKPVAVVEKAAKKPKPIVVVEKAVEKPKPVVVLEKAAKKTKPVTVVGKAVEKPKPLVVVEKKVRKPKPIVVAEKIAKKPKPAVVTEKAVEEIKPIVVAEKIVETPPVVIQPIVKKEVITVKRTPLNDLTVIEGIGPKISQILYDHDVKNFKALIATPIEDLKKWLKENKMPFVDPTTWAEQAQLADEGKMVAFEALKKQLKNGKKQ